VTEVDACFQQKLHGDDLGQWGAPFGFSCAHPMKTNP
jgi:hypothetical protein